jgi:hypothetical protein
MSIIIMAGDDLNGEAAPFSKGGFSFAASVGGLVQMTAPLPLTFD